MPCYFKLSLYITTIVVYTITTIVVYTITIGKASYSMLLFQKFLDLIFKSRIYKNILSRDRGGIFNSPS